jgi:high affinity sulfate transporter 1
MPMGVRLFGAIRPHDGDGVRHDALAGVSLAAMSIPQVLGYTRIAGTPVVTGLYTLLLPLLAFALFGSSRHLVVAADSATAAIFANGLAPLAPAASEKYLALVGALALLTAGLLLVARIFRLGFLADFLSRTVLVGFLAGIGIQVGVAVLGELLGLPIEAKRTLAQIEEILRTLPATHRPTLGVSAVVVGAIVGLRHMLPKVPVALVAVITAIGASYAFDLAARGIAVIGPVPGGLPALALPHVSWREVVALLPVAGSCLLIIVAQSAAAARIFALRHQEPLDENADILGLAAANAAAAVSGAFVVNGSLTQTAMAERAGARSQLAQLLAAGVVAIVLLFLTGPLQYLPRCVLASIVFTIAVGLVDIAGLRDIARESPGEFALAVITAAAVILVGLAQGILLAVALSLLRHVRHSYRPHTAVLRPDATGQWVPAAATPGTVTEPGVVVYRFGADLFYANESRFVGEVRALIRHAPQPVHFLVVDAAAITDLDYSAARSLRELYDELARGGVEVIFGRVAPGLRADMDRHRITPAIGAARLAPTLHEALAIVRAAQGQQGARGNG